VSGIIEPLHYAGIRDKFDRLPFDAVTANEEVEAEKDEIDKKQKEQEALLEELAQRAKLAESEKEDLFEKMARTNEELYSAKNDLRRMQRNITEHKASSSSLESERKLLNYLLKKIEEELPPGMEERLSTSLIRKIFSNIKNDLHPEAIEDLLNLGLMTNGGLHRKVIENIIWLANARDRQKNLV
jgi:flagellar biosynthesis GTPase FlhF